MKERARRREKQDEGDRRLTKCGFQSIAFLRGASNVFRALKCTRCLLENIFYQRARNKK